MEQAVFVDESGVWSLGSSGRKYGIEWAEIVGVSAHKLDGITEIYTCIELDFEYGEYFEFDDSVQGYGEVMEAIAKRLPEFPEGWSDRVQILTVDDAPLELWSK